MFKRVLDCSEYYLKHTLTLYDYLTRLFRVTLQLELIFQTSATEQFVRPLSGCAPEESRFGKRGPLFSTGSLDMFI